VKVVGHGGDYIEYSSILLVCSGTGTAVALLAPAAGLSAGAGAVLPGWAVTLDQQLPRG
jgi:hypothetical protein